MRFHSTNGRHSIQVASAVALTLAIGCAVAQPPSAQSPATRAATDSYRACLVQAVLKSPSAGVIQWSETAKGACTAQEAAVSDAVLKENPDRPLFAQSYAESLREETLARHSALASLPLTVAMRR